MFAHSIKGCRPLGRTCGVLIPSPYVNTTPEPFNLKVRRSRLFRFFRRFPQINVGGDSSRIPFVEHASRESRVALPPKGRLRHKGTTCPKNHLKMYCRKMGAYSKDEKLLMHFFRESLAGEVIAWYTNLESSRICSWKDLMATFIRQYQYNSDMDLNRMQFQNMCKREHESFKEYTQGWRDLAAKVAPPMMEREMIIMIMDTLPMFYYDKMAGYMPLSFVDMIFVGERIEVGLRRGKFDYAASTNVGNRRTETGGAKKKEGDAHAITTAPTWPKSQQTPYNSTYQYPPHQYNYSANMGSPPSLTPIQQRMPTQPQRPFPQNPFPEQPQPNGNPNPNTNTNPTRNFPERNPQSSPRYRYCWIEWPRNN